MKKLINHIRRWNIWRKHCLNSNFHKILVLFGVIKSPTMNSMLLPEAEALLPYIEFERYLDHNGLVIQGKIRIATRV